jgi:hypothetical protein
MGGKMGQADEKEYEVCLRHAKIQVRSGAAFSASWSDGLEMSTEEAVRDAMSGLKSV